MSSTKRKIVVLISGSGTNLQALIDALNTPALPNAEISLALSNKKAAYGLTRAAQANPPIPTAYFAYRKQVQKREEYDAEVAKIVLRVKPDIVVLAGWMHILTEEFLDLVHGEKKIDDEEGLSPTTPIPVINLHPALPGQFDGAHAIERAYEAFQKGEIAHSGAMVHHVVKEVDRGEPIIVREVPFQQGESLEVYEGRLHAVEHEIIVQGTKKVLDEIKPLS
ncbi:phosphoribosylglycinamide formyltransferase [Gymnopilus junonius]|uniref:phosphoribosylglycinamide formyltransferase 1 n=1 Tax=Gymnopilus junonius TaxID=109634 RepID=A0A9P5NX82_GYMJU|nr:phosphoribosylglycinamide formyltransferase [Gymnopilus junonius]